MPIPQTRPSLLVRIRDPQDRDAWDEFSSIYRPVVIQLARIAGLQPADADDLAQQVLLAVSEAITNFEPNTGQAKFRTWLKTIARRAIINALTRGRRDPAAGGDTAASLLQALPDGSPDTQALMMEYRRQIFHVAANMIREEFQPTTWQAFWETVVEDRPVADVAQKLGRSQGSIYTSRSRVVRRLREVVQELDADIPSEES